MTDTDWLERGAAHLWLPYAQMKTAAKPRAAVMTDKTRIRLGTGETLIDGVSSWWTAAHGYNHPALTAAIAAQMQTMPHIMLGGLVHEQACRLATRLAAITPGDLSRVFFTESGSVAVEVAMKIAVQYWRNKTGAEKTRFVSFLGGYHGDTFATMSVCDPEEGMHALFAGAVTPQHHLGLPSTDETAARLDETLRAHDDIAAVIVEPLLQGAGGMLMHDDACLKRMRAICDAHKVLLIFDEIFTGFARTGAMFAAERAGVTPDIMVLGKALTGGVAPLAATLASSDVYAAFHDDDPEKALMHGPTFTGHALACAAANASIDLFEKEPRLRQVATIEAALKTAFDPLKDLPGVADVRVLGAVGAVEMENPFDIEQAREDFIADGVFVRPIGRVIYLAPAYVIEPDDLAVLTRAVAGRVHALSRQ